MSTIIISKVTNNHVKLYTTINNNLLFVPIIHLSIFKYTQYID